VSGENAGYSDRSRLENLNFYKNNVAISKSIQSLNKLNLNFCSLTDITGLGQFTNISELYVSNNSTLTSINGVNNLTRLETFKAENCSINDISYLSTCISLKTLNLSNNNFSSISSLSNLKELTNLSLSNNPISDISPLLGLINSTTGKIKFSTLDLSNCSLVATTSSGVDNIDVLRQLHAAGLTKVTITGNTALTDTTKIECQAYITELLEIFGTGLIYQ